MEDDRSTQQRCDYFTDFNNSKSVSECYQRIQGSISDMLYKQRRTFKKSFQNMFALNF